MPYLLTLELKISIVTGDIFEIENPMENPSKTESFDKIFEIFAF